MVDEGQARDAVAVAQSARVEVRLVVGHLKGGTGKTTSAVLLALALAWSGRRVLLVDADGSNSSTYTWRDMAGDAWPENVRVVRWDTIDLPRLVRDSEHLFDDLVIDTGNDERMLRVALQVANVLVLPVGPQKAEIAKLQSTIDVAAEVAATRQDLHLGILFTRAPARSTNAAALRGHLVDERGLPVFDVSIPSLLKYSDAFGEVPRSLGAYGPLLTEIQQMLTDVDA